MNLNKVFIIGRITSDIALRVTAGNQPVTSFGVATNRVWTDKSGAKQEQAEFHNVVVWGRQAELASQFLSKGSLVMIEGRLQTRTWKGNDGQNRRTTEIVCERIQFGPRSAASGGSFSKPSAGEVTKEKPSPSSLEGEFKDIPEISLDEEIKPEDLPF
jgi:single-strand DNA-binding protein